MTPRHMLLGVALVATLAAAFWPRQEGDEEGNDDLEVVEPVARRTPALPSVSPPAAQAEATPGTPAGTAAPVQRFTAEDLINLFPAQSFRPPPKPVPPPVIPPPPPPMAPPVPFTFVGAWTEGGRETIFLERGSQPVSAHVGDTLAGGWRLDAFTPEGLTFTYVSLNQQRTLRIGP